MWDWAPVSRDPIGQFLAQEFLQEDTCLLGVFNYTLFAKLDNIVDHKSPLLEQEPTMNGWKIK